jgi:hypothetical protein
MNSNKLSVIDVLGQVNVSELMAMINESALISHVERMEDETLVFTMSTGMQIMLSPDPDTQEVWVREQEGTKEHVLDAAVLNNLSLPVLNLMFIVYTSGSISPMSVLMRCGGSLSVSSELLEEILFGK